MVNQMDNSQYFEVITDAVTGEQTIRMYTPEEIAETIENERRSSIPASVTPRQVRLLLLQQGLLSQIETMIAGLDQASQITWEFAIEFHRNDPLLNALGAQLGLTEEQIDQFFIEAAAL